jgi:hypothetical protein
VSTGMREWHLKLKKRAKVGKVVIEATLEGQHWVLSVMD